MKRNLKQFTHSYRKKIKVLSVICCLLLSIMHLSSYVKATSGITSALSMANVLNQVSANSCSVNTDKNTVTLLKNIEISESLSITDGTIILDLNGQILKGNENTTFEPGIETIQVYNNANLTIIDNKETGKVIGGMGSSSETMDDDGYAGGDAIHVFDGILTIKDGIILGGDGGGGCTGGDAGNDITVDGGKVIINDGTFDAVIGQVGDTAGISGNGLNVKGGDVTITGGTFTGANSGNRSSAVVISAGTVSISGGTFSVEEYPYDWRPAIDAASIPSIIKGGYAAYDNSVPPAIIPNEKLSRATYIKVMPIVYTASFNLNGKPGIAPISQTIAHGSRLSAPDEPVAVGYTFGGWYQEKECINKWNFTTGTITANMTLYAKWDLSTYAITYELNGGSNAPSNPEAYTIESDDINLAIPSKKGFTFTGWTINGISTPQPDMIITKGSRGDKTFIANWTPNIYPVILDGNGGNGSSLTNYTYGKSIALPTDYTKSGYTFAGWYDNPQFNGAPVKIISADQDGSITFYALWVKDNATDTKDNSNIWFWALLALASAYVGGSSIKHKYAK